MSEKKVLYFSGLSGFKSDGFDTRIFRHLRRRGIRLEPALFDWRSKRVKSANLLDYMTDQANDLLKSSGSLALVGASAGGSLALNVFGRLDSAKDIRAVSLSGRLYSGDLDLPAWDSRILSRSTHLGTKRASQLCYDSIMHCERRTIPGLDEAQKQQITTTRPLLDPVVPVATMGIEGVDSIIVPAVGHKLGIALGLLKLPDILE